MQPKIIGGERVGYELSRKEFSVIAQNLRKFGHIGVVAEILANDPTSNIAKRESLRNVAHMRRLDIIAHAHSDESVVGGIISKLRLERNLTRSAVYPEGIGLLGKNTPVVLGEAAMAATSVQLSPALDASAEGLSHPDELIAILDAYDEYHEAGVEEQRQIHET